MAKKDKILITILAIGSIFSIGLTFYKTIYLGDFEAIDTEPISELESSDE